MIKKNICTLVPLLFITSVQAAPYSIRDLGDLAESTSFGRDINNQGSIVGNFVGKSLIQADIGLQAFEFNSHGFIFDGINFTDIGTLIPDVSSTDTTAFSINDLGEVTGESFELVDENRLRTAFLYKDGVLISLGVPMIADLNISGSKGLDINNNGIIVGQIFAENPNSASNILERAVIIDPNATEKYTLLPDLKMDDTAASSARAINDSGQIVGWSFFDEQVSIVPRTHATFYDSSLQQPQLEDLGTLGGEISSANDINNNGVIVGRSTLENSSVLQAFVLDHGAGTEMLSLGTLNPDDSTAISIAQKINDNNQIVGFSEVPPTDADRLTKPTHAFLYENNNMVDLNQQIDCSLGWELSIAESINNNGEIVGTGLINNELHAFLLTPTPNDGPADNSCIDESRNLFDGSGGSGGGFGYKTLLALLLVLGYRKFVL